MTIPLDRLYDHLDALSNHDLIIYRFVPHGSKKIENLKPIRRPQNWLFQMTRMQMICHDQEPLFFEHYTDHDYARLVDEMPWLSHRRQELLAMKMRLATRPAVENAYDKILLTHSERNSLQLARYQESGMVGIYWWSHAAIARDWYRYAQCDPLLHHELDQQWQHDFLIYNRAWSGTREYRLKFAELLLDHNIVSNCNMTFSLQDNGADYRSHNFVNPQFTIQRQDLHKQIKPNQFDASASADYVAQDYANSAVEVVLETLFDDNRHHLTEKTLRAIACGQPFMLMATAGSLAYLRSYGFETFSPWIDETYDTIQDPWQRMQCVATEMKRFMNKPQTQKIEAVIHMRQIAARNRQRFFDPAWSQSIWQELCDNANEAIREVHASRCATIWQSRKTRGESEDWTFPEFKSAGDIGKFYQWLNTEQQPPVFTLAKTAV